MTELTPEEIINKFIKETLESEQSNLSSHVVSLKSKQSSLSQYITPLETEHIVKPTQNKFIQIAENVQQERLNICKSCEFYKNESDGPVCTQCNCSLNKKISLVEESCPLKKWMTIKTQSSGGCGCNKK